MRHLFQIGAVALGLACGGAEATAPEAEVVKEPTSRTLEISRAEGGGVRGQGKHGSWAEVAAAYDITGTSKGGYPGRMYAEAVITLGSKEHPIAKSWVWSGWSNEGGDYRVATDVRWKGFFTGVGAAGAGAKMTFVLKILDFRGNLLASEVLHEREVREYALTVAALKDEGTKSAVVNFTLPPNTGGPFRIQFELTCESFSGLLGADVLCLFGKTPDFVKAGLGGYAEWTKLSVTDFPK